MQQQHDQQADSKRKFNVVYGLMLMHQRAIVLLSRDRWGKEALGKPCFLALVLMFLWATFSRDPFMWVWLAVWVCFLVKRRLESVRLATSGERTHSQYDGHPFAALTFCRTENAAKLVGEPVLVGILGVVLCAVYQEVGLPVGGLPCFLLAGCVSLPFVEAVKKQIWERRIQGMQDARLEQEQMVRESRERYGE